MSETNVTIEAEVAAPPSKVWSYWTEPKHITQWNFASPDWGCPSASNDLKVGGKYSARMEAKDESFGFDFEAIYDEIVTNKKIVYTMMDNRKVSTTFEEVGNRTRITTTFAAEKENPVEMQKAGWQAILDNFKRYTEKN